MLPCAQFATSIHFIPFKPCSPKTPLSHVIIQLLNQYIGINILIVENVFIYIHLHEEDNKKACVLSSKTNNNNNIVEKII